MAAITEQILLPDECSDAINIVVVDDDEITLECIKRFLRGANCKLHLFDKVTPAKNHLIAHQPDLLFVDLRMPTITGVEFLTDLTVQKVPLGVYTYLQSAAKPPDDIYEFAKNLNIKIILKDNFMNKQWLHEAIQSCRDEMRNGAIDTTPLNH